MAIHVLFRGEILTTNHHVSSDLYPVGNSRHLLIAVHYEVYCLQTLTHAQSCFYRLSSLLAFSEEPTNVAPKFGAFGPGGWLHWTSEEEWAVLYAQNIMLVVFVWYLGELPWLQSI